MLIYYMIPSEPHNLLVLTVFKMPVFDIVNLSKNGDSVDK
jgi:hypothetical protein